MSTMIQPRLMSRTGAPGTRANVLKRTVAHVHGTHTGMMFTMVGFVWFFAAAIVLLSDTLTSVWGAASTILVLWFIGRRIRGLLRKPPHPARTSCE